MSKYKDVIEVVRRKATPHDVQYGIASHVGEELYDATFFGGPVGMCGPLSKKDAILAVIDYMLSPAWDAPWPNDGVVT